MEKIKVLIVDDQALFVSGTRILLEAYGDGEITVCATASNGKEAIDAVKREIPDVILMDVRMPVMDGVEATKLIHDAYPDINILILTTFDDDQYVIDALANGALGYVLKNVKPVELVASINAVQAGTFSVSPSVGYKLVQQAQDGVRMNEQKLQGYKGEINFLMSYFESLTPRETEILYHILIDFDNHEIAEKLFIAEQTVRNHISAIYSKLGVNDRIHAKKLVKEKVG